MNDLISRQEAIDALCSECQGQCIPCESFPCSEIDVINGLPAAQPEIIRCKDCKFSDEFDCGVWICRRYKESFRVLSFDTCKVAERRKDA